MVLFIHIIYSRTVIDIHKKALNKSMKENKYYNTLSVLDILNKS